MAPEKKTRKILLVDDEAGFAELLRDLLEMDSYEVVLAYDGQEAIEKLQVFTPDAIISDIVMPRLSGFEMFKKVKANPVTAGIPDRKSTRLNSSHAIPSRMPSSA